MNKKMLTKTHIDLSCACRNRPLKSLNKSLLCRSSPAMALSVLQKMITELEKENEELKKIISDRTRRQHHE